MMMLSEMISFSMAHGLAPIALRIPNSCVRSLTEISMMLETPTIPLNSVRIPMIQSAVLIIDIPLFISMLIVRRFHIPTALLSSGAALWLLFSDARSRSSNALLSSSVSSPWNEKVYSSISLPLL